jgi:hypothetical protein
MHTAGGRMTYHLRVSSKSSLMRSAAAAAVLLLAAACGDDTGSSAEDPADDTAASQEPSATEGASEPPAADLPACADVWVTGATLPRSYRGCEQDGESIKADKHPCSYGAAIVEFADRFYAVTGKQINEVPSLTDSDQYQQALSACQG